MPSAVTVLDLLVWSYSLEVRDMFSFKGYVQFKENSVVTQFSLFSDTPPPPYSHFSPLPEHKPLSK